MMIDKRTRYEELVYDVAAWNPLDGTSPDALYDACQQFISTAHPLREHGITLKYHLLLKAGQQYRHNNKHSFGQLQRLCGRYGNIAAQAQWILARLYLSDVNAAKSEHDKWHLHATACELLSGIKTTMQFDVPILLPGIRSEISSDYLNADFNGLAEPKVYTVPIPHRYLSNLKLNQAYHEHPTDPKKAINLIWDAKRDCHTSIQKYGRNSPFLSMNIDLCNNDNDVMLLLKGITSINKTKLIDKYLKYIDQLETYIRSHQIPEIKAREWQAASNAALAALFPADDINHRLHWDLCYQQVNNIVQKSKGLADFFDIDIMYHLANKTPEEETAFKKAIIYTHLAAAPLDIYYNVLNYIIKFGKGQEKLSRLKKTLDEETYRDQLIPGLNAAFPEILASAETYNNKGKTDILIADRAGNNILIAECKLWKGERYLLQALDQLFGRYINWRDDKAALIFFNKDVHSFTRITDVAINTIKNHRLFKAFPGLSNDAAYSFVFRHPVDEHKTLQLELILLNFV